MGSGGSGSNAAYLCRSAGMDIAIIDHSPFGGTCALRGCNPKKVLHGAAHISELVENMSTVLKGSVDVDWERLIGFKKTFIEKIPAQREKGLDYRINMADSTKWYNSRRLGFKKTGYKVLIDKKTDRIIGAHILAPGV
ncbi:MAG: hypothetical protein MUP02_08805, partial [Actinobacteria bacterium]|nr:hypothetical protein [Actinomycetota bacterium]